MFWSELCLDLQAVQKKLLLTLNKAVLWCQDGSTGGCRLSGSLFPLSGPLSDRWKLSPVTVWDIKYRRVCQTSLLSHHSSGYCCQLFRGGSYKQHWGGRLNLWGYFQWLSLKDDVWWPRHPVLHEMSFLTHFLEELESLLQMRKEEFCSRHFPILEKIWRVKKTPASDGTFEVSYFSCFNHLSPRYSIEMTPTNK